jgi:hypothetical protein
VVGSEIFGAKNLESLETNLNPNHNSGLLQNLFTKEEKTDKPYLCEGLGVWNVVKNF